MAPLLRSTKRRRATQSALSEADSDQEQDIGRSVKKVRQSSPQRVRNAALSKAASQSVTAKGMAGFKALVSQASLSAAYTETTKGLRSGSSSMERPNSSRVTSGSRSKAVKMDDGFLVGTIVFLVTGIKENIPAPGSSKQASSFFVPVYCLKSDVDVSPLALTGMKQSGLCIMSDTGFELSATDTYLSLDAKLRSWFPRLFDWIDEEELEREEVSACSSWLICMKAPYRRGIYVYSDDSLPTSLDAINACQLSKSKAVTRFEVPHTVLLTWRPKVSSTFRISEESDIEDSGMQSDSNFGSEDHHDIISISDNNDSSDSSEIEEVEMLSTQISSDFPTADSSLVEYPQLSLTDSQAFNFDSDANPWNQ